MTKLKKLKKIFKVFKIDGYIVPKNDEFFGEYIEESKDNLKFISDFSGSFGFALILKKENYLFVDGRYTLQAKIQSGKKFKIVTIPKKFPNLEVSGDDRPLSANINRTPVIKNKIEDKLADII